MGGDLAPVHEAGFREVRHLSADSLNECYFAGRTEEPLIVAT